MKSSHLESKLKEEIYNALPSGHRTFNGQRHDRMQDMGNKKEFPERRISPAIREEDEAGAADSNLSFKTPQLIYFKCMSKKAMYYIIVETIHKDSLRRQKDSRWPDLLIPDFLVRDRWRTQYKPAVEKCTADLQWRIIHGAIATDGHVTLLNTAVNGDCWFCGEKEDLELVLD